MIWLSDRWRFRLVAGGVVLAGASAFGAARATAASRGHDASGDPRHHGIVAAGRHYSVAGGYPQAAARWKCRPMRGVATVFRGGVRDLAFRVGGDVPAMIYDAKTANHRHQRPGPAPKAATPTVCNAAE